MMQENRAAALSAFIEREDSYNYERWEERAQFLFELLGVLRGVTEGTLTRAEQETATRASRSAFILLERSSPKEDIEQLHTAILGLDTPNTQNENFLRDVIGSAIQYANRRMIETAPSANVRAAEDTAHVAAKETINPSHLWLNGQEPLEIANSLSAALDTENGGPDYSFLFSTIGTLQRLLVIVEKLRQRIDDGEIDIGGRDTDECIEAITKARDTIIRALIPDTTSGSVISPDVDPSLVDEEILDTAWDIAGWLSGVKERSV